MASGFMGSRICAVLEFLNNLWGARKRVGRGLLYRPARLHNLAELVPRKSESILGLLKSLKIVARFSNIQYVKTTKHICCYWNWRYPSPPPPQANIGKAFTSLTERRKT
jgi:hypothetical protein